MTRCSCGAFLGGRTHTHTHAFDTSRKRKEDPPRTPTTNKRLNEATRAKQKHQEQKPRTPLKERTRRPTKRQTKHQQKQRQTMDREDDPAQPLLPQEKPGVLRIKKKTTPNPKNVAQHKNKNDYDITSKSKGLEQPTKQSQKQKTKQDPRGSKV